MVRGPKDATTLLNAYRAIDGRSILTWATPSGKKQTVNTYPWPRRIDMSETESLLYLQWNHLMSKVEIIFGGPQPGLSDDENRGAVQRARYEARGIAEVLAMQMKPFVQSADDVVRHAVARHKNPDYEVPGLGEHLWDPMRNADGSLRIQLGGAAPKSRAAAKPKSKLSDDQLKTLRQAVESGMFKPEDIAPVYGLTSSEVRAVLASG